MLEPIDTVYTTHTLAKPVDWNDKHGTCRPLPICRVGDVSYSWYKVPFKARLAILFGAPVRLAVWSMIHPPVAVEVDTHINATNRNIKKAMDLQP